MVLLAIRIASSVVSKVRIDKTGPKISSFAIAISGTPQHLAGVSGQARIVALNSDKDAPIFTRCDVGVVGDWREILPLLAGELEATIGPVRG